MLCSPKRVGDGGRWAPATPPGFSSLWSCAPYGAFSHGTAIWIAIEFCNQAATAYPCGEQSLFKKPTQYGKRVILCHLKCSCRRCFSVHPDFCDTAMNTRFKFVFLLLAAVAVTAFAGVKAPFYQYDASAFYEEQRPEQPWLGAQMISLKVAAGTTVWLSNYVSNWYTPIPDLHGNVYNMSEGKYGYIRKSPIRTTAALRRRRRPATSSTLSTPMTRSSS